MAARRRRLAFCSPDNAFDEQGDLSKESLQKVLKQYVDAFAGFVDRHHK